MGETIKIELPKELVEKLEKRCEGSAFEDVSTYITYVLKKFLSKVENQQDKPSKEQEDQAKQQLKSLGYL